MTVLTGGEILTPSGWVTSDVTIDNGLIGAIDSADERRGQGPVIDISGLRLIPGLIDLQINGGFGHDFTNDPETIWEVGALLPKHGVTAFLPTIITAPPTTTNLALRVLSAGPPDGYLGAVPIGLHIEGPMLSPRRRGTHDPALLREPAEVQTDSWHPRNGVRMVTLAPELPGSLDLIAELADRGGVVSLGHSDANCMQAVEGFGRGATVATHLFNAMSPFHHRDPGMVGAVLELTDVTAELIVDGIHSHPGAVRLAWAMKKPDRLVLITDAMAAMGMGHGQFSIGNIDVIVDDTGPRNSAGDLAGSNLTLDSAVRNLQEFTNCSQAEAIGAATANPARVLGDITRGRIETGARADLAVVRRNLDIAMTFVGGEMAYAAPPSTDISPRKKETQLQGGRK